jgi:hypothetical protein
MAAPTMQAQPIVLPPVHQQFSHGFEEASLQDHPFQTQSLSPCHKLSRNILYSYKFNPKQ